MSQFATMIPISGGSPTLKTASGINPDGASTDLTEEGQGLSFAQTLQELTDANPNAAALLLVLQQAGMMSELPVSLQAGGSVLPPTGGTTGNALPLPQLQSLQLSGLQALPMEGLPSLDSRQLQQLLADKPMAGKQLLVAQAVKSGLVGEGLASLESGTKAEFNTQLQAAGLNLQSGQTAAAQRPLALPPVQVPVGQPGWGGEVGQRIHYMVSQNVQQAEIKLTPPELGPMEIKISLQHDHTQVQFVAHHSATRDALEAAIPRLRELFGEVNLNLGNVDVSQRDAGASAQNGSGGEGSGAPGQASGEGFGLTQESAATVTQWQRQGLLDTYA